MAVCIESGYLGYIVLMDAATGTVKEFTQVPCLPKTPMSRSGDRVVSFGPYPTSSYTMRFFSLPFTGGLPRLSSTTYEIPISAGSIGDPFTVMGSRHSDGDNSYFVEVFDSRGNSKLVVDTARQVYPPKVVAVSKPIGTTTSFYVAVASDYTVFVHLQSGSQLLSYDLPDRATVIALTFQGEHTLVIVARTSSKETKQVSHTVVYDLKTDAHTTFTNDDWYISSVAFNDEGSHMAVSGSQGGGEQGTPFIYIMDLSTGLVQTLCEQTVENKTGGWASYVNVSFVTDGQGRGMVLAQTRTKPSSIQALQVTLTAPEGQAHVSDGVKSAPIQSIMHVVYNKVALLVAAGVGFCLWKMLQVAPQQDKGVAGPAGVPPAEVL
eukprot:TRINITY_DN724_c3_g1_i2.p1 TRINITY_DN724_c3_g1~~TRINITY_DN724_c3_g1_i2.p1  ORF type:complete len:422 (+),score=42.96 TRINITY_DN724_c3_g1_i2:135-1268(+)